MLPRLWSSQLELAEEPEMVLCLSQASLASSDALRPDQEARSSASSGSAESMLLACSSSEEIENRKLYRVTSWKASVLHSKPCQFTSWLLGKAYMMMGQAGGAVHC